MAHNIQTKIDKILQPFAARVAELEARRQHGSDLRREALAIYKEAAQARREFAEAVPGEDYKQALADVASGSRNVRNLHIASRAEEISQHQRQARIAEEAAEAVVADIENEERQIAQEAGLALHTVWAELAGDLVKHLRGVTQFLRATDEATAAIRAARIRRLDIQIGVHWFANLDLDNPESWANRWLEDHAHLTNEAGITGR
jgi:hypothetical protein